MRFLVVESVKTVTVPEKALPSSQRIRPEFDADDSEFLDRGICVSP